MKRNLITIGNLDLKPGMIVKMKGCRDGFGWREIIQVNENNWGKRVVCWALNEVAHRHSYAENEPIIKNWPLQGRPQIYWAAGIPEKCKKYQLERRHQVTDHDISKVTHYYDPKINMFYKVKNAR